MTHPPQTPPGWYDDGSGRKRWWDGAAWGAFADQPAPSHAPATPGAPKKSRAGLIIGLAIFVVLVMALGIGAAVLSGGGTSGAEKAHESLVEAFDECDPDLFRDVTSRNYRRNFGGTDSFMEVCRSYDRTIGDPDEVFENIKDFEDWCDDEFGDYCDANSQWSEEYEDALDDFTGDADRATVIIARISDDDGWRGNAAFFYAKVDGDWVLEMRWHLPEEDYYDDYYDDDYYEYYDDDYDYGYY